MRIEDGRVVEIDYTLRDDEGRVIDTSDGDEPLTYLHGAGQIVPGLEKALEGRDAGEQLKVVVAPEDGYGSRHADRVIQVNRSELPEGPDPEVGMELEAVGRGGEHMMLWISAVEGDQITLDGNHPLAGTTLHFEVAVKSVREATEEEKKHGHAHGPGDHDHGHDHGHGHGHHHH